MKPYSPSKSTDFMQNPVVRELKQQGWVPTVYGYPQLALIAGSAYGKGQSHYYRMRQADQTGTARIPPLSWIEDACDVALQTFTEELARIRGKAIVWKDDVYPSVAPSGDQLVKTLRKGLTSDPIPPNWEILDVEPYWKKWGYVKPDIVVKTDAGRIFPIDGKYKRQMDTDRLAQTLAEYCYSWQFMHYNWATCMEYGLDYEAPATHGLLLSISRPHRVDPHYFPIDPVLRKLWFISARSVWAMIAATEGDTSHLTEWINQNDGVLPPWHTFLFHGRYGLDPYGEAVLYHKLDPYLMAQSYTNLKAKGQEPGAPEVKESEL